MKILDILQPKCQYNHQTENKVAIITFSQVLMKNYLNFFLKSITLQSGYCYYKKFTVELIFQVGDIELHKILIIVMEKLTGPMIGVIFFQSNYRVLVKRQRHPQHSLFFHPFQDDGSSKLKCYGTRIQS